MFSNDANIRFTITDIKLRLSKTKPIAKGLIRNPCYVIDDIICLKDISGYETYYEYENPFPISTDVQYAKNIKLSKKK